MRIKLVSFLCLFLASISVSFSQQTNITGVVKGGNQEVISGASIRVKGLHTTTTSDRQGFFSIQVNSLKDILLVSYLGYESREVSVSSIEDMVIELKPKNDALEEVVVLGYGSAKREKVLGAVSQIGEQQFENRPVTSVGAALQGAISNLQVTMGDAQPNRGATLNVRGFTSVNGGSPLVLVDGVPGEINYLNPEDIASVSVLKDASSAAIYGARASYGVILITTKSGGKGKVNVKYNNNIGVNEPLRTPKTISSPMLAAEIQQEAWRGFYDADNADLVKVIDYLKRYEKDPTLEPEWVSNATGYVTGSPVDWYAEMFNKTQPFAKHTLTMDGGNDKLSFFLSGGYQNQKGVYKVATDDFKRYNGRSKIAFEVNKYLHITNNTEYSGREYDTPNKFVTGGNNFQRFTSQFSHPWSAIYTADGSYTYGGMFAIGQLKEGGRDISKQSVFRNTFNAQATLIPDVLKLTGEYSAYWNKNRNDVQRLRVPYRQSNTVITELASQPNDYGSAYSQGYLGTFNLYANYTQQLDDHYLGATVGVNQEQNAYSTFNVWRTNNLVEGLASLNLTNGDATLSDNKYEWATLGYFYRLNYDYKSTYLVEFNGRYDGTSRFPKESRWGFFPSAAIGYNMANESYFEPLKPYINALKLRASYGSLGNQQVDTYSYISSMGVSQLPKVLDGVYPQRVGVPGLVAPDLTWEKVNTANIGLDVAAFKQRLQLSLDWYNRKTIGMLTAGETLPAVLGTAVPKVNAADVSTKGWEMTLGWQDQFQLANKPFNYGVRVVLSDNRATITKFSNTTGLLSNYYKGYEIGQIWGLTTEGLFQSDEEYKTHADQRKVQEVEYLRGGHPMAGDIKFADRNGDKEISLGSNTLADPGDQHIIGNSSIRLPYSVGFNFNWSNIDLSAFFQGVGKRDFWPGRESAYFWGFYNRWNNPVYEHMENNYWTPENTDAYFPRLRAYQANPASSTRSLSVVQTRYLQDASYLRLKSVVLGYRIHNPWLERAGISSIRVFASGENLLTWTRMSKALDPEALNDEVDSNTFNGSGFVYPVQRTITGGLEINF
ncbi:SusC/RagA family TonB-linked outer membrane protein [Sphingobacterium faecale]|uniref:TonB-dependent receptor n=1 Tax=Sphingobacterium faecale TaxID=2803775 RepID=A0ABS1R9T2_9SPHI|nr:TonB-dependent receptor [Sphingobacterium faecale]MBL1410979.1 TonB-dependent receptor [Sphingobacterium faecale]